MFLEYRPHCGLIARASTVLAGPAYSATDLLEKSSKSADLANRSGHVHVQYCEEHKKGAPADVIRGEGMGWPVPLPILTELTMSLGFLCNMVMGAKEVCCGVLEGVLDDKHGQKFFF